VHDDAEEVIAVVPKLCFWWYLRIDENLVVNVVRLGSRTCEWTWNQITGPSPITCLWPNTLADLSKFFSKLSDLKSLGSPSQALQISFEGKPNDQPKKSSKEYTFFWIAKLLFFFFHFDPFYF
jgi:hypothetical protein